MGKFLENAKLQKDIWFVVSTLTFLIVIFYLRAKDFLPYGVACCIGYVVLICVGFLLIDLKAERRKRKE